MAICDFLMPSPHMYSDTRFPPVPRQETPRPNMASHYTPSNIVITLPPCCRGPRLSLVTFKPNSGFPLFVAKDGKFCILGHRGKFRYTSNIDLKQTHSIVQTPPTILTSSRLDILAYSSTSEDVDNNPIPQIQTVFWARISMPVVLPQLCAKIDKAKHSTELSGTLAMSHCHLPLERAVNKLPHLSVMHRARGDFTGTHVRSG